MATEYSFDAVSKADPQEVKNAIQQAQREIETRFDFRGSVSEIDHDGKEKITLTSDDEARLTALIDVLQSKMIKRGIDIKFLDYGKLEQASKGTVRQVVTIKNGLPTETAKKIVKLIKDKGLKVTTQIQDEQLRVTGKNKDDLQEAMTVMKAADLDAPIQFTNYR
ncbi:MAG: YajQ family cyclic di-GMP-binding protein [Janthinobacterium lividum]